MWVYKIVNNGDRLAGIWRRRKLKTTTKLIAVLRSSRHKHIEAIKSIIKSSNIAGIVSVTNKAWLYILFNGIHLWFRSLFSTFSKVFLSAFLSPFFSIVTSASRLLSLVFKTKKILISLPKYLFSLLFIFFTVKL